MGRSVAVSGAVLLIVTVFCGGNAIAADLAASKSPEHFGYAEFHKQVQPFFNKYCVQCHSADGSEPDIRFDLFTDDTTLEKWSPMLDKAVSMLSQQKMPPKKELQPSTEERAAALAWLQTYSANANCDDPATRNPGRVTIHRLNRAEYNNTIRDLLAMDISPADAFPADDAGYGFDNNGDVLAIAPVLMEKYLSAAELVLNKAILSDPVVPPASKQWIAATMDGSIPPADPNASAGSGFNAQRTMPIGRVFNYSGEIFVDYDFPIDGQYALQMRAYGRQQPTAQFTLDGENVGKPIRGFEDIQNTKVYGSGAIKVTAGKHRVGLVLANGATKEQYDLVLAAAAEAAAKAATQPAEAPPQVAIADNVNNEDAAVTAPKPQASNVNNEDTAVAVPKPQQAADGADAVPPAQAQRRVGAGRRGNRGNRGARGGTRGGRGGGGPSAGPVMGVVYVEVEGPLEPTPDRMSESYRRVMIAHPSATLTKEQAAEQIIRNFASKAFRRPVTDDEVKQLIGIFAKFDSQGDTFDTSIYTTLQAVLASPNFLFRYERDPGPDDTSGVRTIDEFELASRLSYFLWSSMPDDELFNLAQKGQLRANLDAQVRRMMKDPKSQALVDNFAGQWLRLRMMDTAAPDTKNFPDFDEALRQAMLTETRMFFLSIMQEDHSILDFLNADYTFLNERLAKFYGIEGVTGDEFRRVKLNSDQRGGLLTQASILTITSYPGRSSPVQRGKWVLENLLDQAPPPPPPDVPALKDHTQVKGTLRQRMEQHRSNPACATCHEQMDAIGFGLENFNAIGAWRTTDEDAVIDPSGSLPGGQKFTGPAELKKALMSRQDDFCRTLTGKLLTYALGRGLEKYDKCTVDDIDQNVKKDGYKFSMLVSQIVQSEPFQKRSAK